MLVAEAQIKN